MAVVDIDSVNCNVLQDAPCLYDSPCSLQEVPACTVPSAGAERIRKRFASSRKSLWVWFIEVTIFRVLSHHGIALHGMELPTQSERSRLTASVEGQVFAAELLTRSLIPQVSLVKPRSSQAVNGLQPFAKYANNLNTTSGSNTGKVGRVQLPMMRYHKPKNVPVPLLAPAGPPAAPNPAQAPPPPATPNPAQAAPPPAAPNTAHAVQPTTVANADAFSAEDEALKSCGLFVELNTPSKLMKLPLDRLVTLCVRSFWMVYAPIVITCEGEMRSYRPIGLGGSAMSRPKALAWFKDNHQRLHDSIISTAEYKVANSKECLKPLPCGLFANGRGCREFVKVARALFVDVMALHCLRQERGDPAALGLRMTKGSGSFDWSALEILIPPRFDRMSVTGTAALWAHLTTGNCVTLHSSSENSHGQVTWFQFIAYQLREFLPVQLSKDAHHQSFTVASKRRHCSVSGQSGATVSAQPEQAPRRKRVGSCLPPEEPSRKSVRTNALRQRQANPTMPCPDEATRASQIHCSVR